MRQLAYNQGVEAYSLVSFEARIQSGVNQTGNLDRRDKGQTRTYDVT